MPRGCARCSSCFAAVPFALLFVVAASAQEARENGDEADSEQIEPFEEEERKPLEIKTLWDLRLVRSDTPASFFEGGFGKARYGTGGAEPQTFARASQASVVVDVHPTKTLTAHVQMNFDLEPEFPHRRDGVVDRFGIVELFLEWLPSSDTGLGLGLEAKGGIFFPPISLEHIGEAWSTVYTLTPSAVNAWIGEEVRVTGGELTVKHTGFDNEVAFRVAPFVNNDVTGSLLGYRGFALHDRQSAIRDRLPIPPLPAVAEDGIFRHQAPYVEPFLEIDNRLGYYAGASFENYSRFHVNGLFYDNRGTPDSFESGQYGWRTRFGNAGALVFLPADSELLGQYLDGDTHMGLYASGAPQIRARFRAGYLLYTLPFGRQRLSFRYDRFHVEDRDGLSPPFDLSDETGSAMTFAYFVRLWDRQRIGLEVLRIESDRFARRVIGANERASELLIQLSLRLQF